MYSAKLCPGHPGPRPSDTATPPRCRGRTTASSWQATGQTQATPDPPHQKCRPYCRTVPEISAPSAGPGSNQQELTASAGTAATSAPGASPPPTAAPHAAAHSHPGTGSRHRPEPADVLQAASAPPSAAQQQPAAAVAAAQMSNGDPHQPALPTPPSLDAQPGLQQQMRRIRVMTMNIRGLGNATAQADLVDAIA
jgi:hypothetical protein